MAAILLKKLYLCVGVCHELLGKNNRNRRVISRFFFPQVMGAAAYTSVRLIYGLVPEKMSISNAKCVLLKYRVWLFFDLRQLCALSILSPDFFFPLTTSQFKVSVVFRFLCFCMYVCESVIICICVCVCVWLYLCLLVGVIILSVAASVENKQMNKQTKTEERTFITRNEKQIN